MSSKLAFNRLCDIPQITLDHFRDKKTCIKRALFITKEIEVSVTTSDLEERRREGAKHVTLALIDSVHLSNRDQRVSLRVFERVMVPRDFHPGENVRRSAFSIDFHAVKIHPTSSTEVWEIGKGYWVQESVVAQWDSQIENIDSGFDQPEPGYWFDMFSFSRELETAVLVKGHWQYEWHPRGNYSKRPG